MKTRQQLKEMIPEGMSLTDATIESFEQMASKEGLENYLMGVIGSGIVSSPSTFSQAFITQGDNLNKIESFTTRLGDLQMQRSQNAAFRKAMDIEIAQVESDFKDFLNNTTNIANILTKEQQDEVTSIINKKEENNKDIEDLDKAYKANEINLNQYRTAKAALVNNNLSSCLA